MEKDELLKPRIEMIAPIPKIFSCGIEVGDIWIGEEEGNDTIFNLTGAHRIDLAAVKKYPHLFKELEWWDKRLVGDMPKYLKYTINGFVFKYQDCITENDKFGEYVFSLRYCVPSTEAEYNEFANK